MHSISQHECNENAQNKKSSNTFQATKEQPSRTVVYAKLEMTNPDSSEEVEADAIANDIVQGGKIARSIFAGGAGGGISVSSQMEGRLNSLQGGGQVMPDGLRNMMESGFNRDFSQVRLHTDSEAASLSSSIHAKAFTHGNDIYFNQGQFSPNTYEGQKLMAHELTHVVQGGERVCRKSGNEEGWEYIKEPDWITGKVLTYNAQKKLWENYKDKSKKKTITVVLYTNHLDACHGEYKDMCPFEERTHIKKDIQEKKSMNEQIPDYSDLELSGLITSEKETNVYFIQGLHNPTSALINLVKTYGYLQNLIIAGHGNYNVVEVNGHFSLTVGDDKLSTFFETVKNLFKETDDKTGKTKHSILLAECLTGSNPNLGIANSIKCLMDPLDVKVIANRASVYDLHQKYLYKNGYLVFENIKDPTSPTEQAACVNSFSSLLTSSTDHYAGNESGGILMDVMRRIDADEPVDIHNYDCNNTWFYVKNEHVKVYFESTTLFAFINNHYNSSGKDKMLSFLTALFGNELPDNANFVNQPHVSIDSNGDRVASVSFLVEYYNNFHGTKHIVFRNSWRNLLSF